MSNAHKSKQHVDFHHFALMLALSASACGDTTPDKHNSETLYKAESAFNRPQSALLTDDGDQESIRIYATNDQDSSISVGEHTAIEICSEKDCTPGVIKQKRLSTKSNKDGLSDLLTEGSPKKTGSIITNLIIKTNDNKQTKHKKIEITPPIDFSYPLKKYDIVITSSQNKTCKSLDCANEVKAISAPRGEKTRNIIYNPNFSMEATPFEGISIYIPKGATDSTKIISVIAHDTGGSYPQIEIYPHIKLNNPMTVSIKPIRTKSEYAYIDNGESDSPKEDISININRTGIIRNGEFVKTDSISKKDSISGNRMSECTGKLSLYRNPIVLDHVVRVINDCINIPPFIHIVATGWGNNYGIEYGLHFNIIKEEKRFFNFLKGGMGLRQKKKYRISQNLVLR